MQETEAVVNSNVQLLHPDGQSLLFRILFNTKKLKKFIFTLNSMTSVTHAELRHQYKVVETAETGQIVA